MWKLAPSILSANFANLEDEIRKIEVPGVEYVHIDVMDGVFVPNITVGQPVVRAIKKISKLPLDVHIMIQNPEKYAKSFADAGADLLTFHFEASSSPGELLREIRSYGIKAGVSIKPDTPFDVLKGFMDDMDVILVMTVEPGFGGQKLIHGTLDKVKEIKRIRDKNKLNFIIQVDGGVTEDNISEYVSSGADIIVAGNAVFGSDNPRQAIFNLISKGNG